MMALKEIIEGIEEDIKKIKSISNIDVSRELGSVLYSFVSYWGRNKEYESAKKSFFDVMVGLEIYLILRTNRNLHFKETIRKQDEFEKIINVKDEKELSGLSAYFNQLKRRFKEEENIYQLCPIIPEKF